jgi:hypothetical protein
MMKVPLNRPFIVLIKFDDDYKYNLAISMRSICTSISVFTNLVVTHF